MKSPHSKIKRVTANTFGALGYLFSTLQWFWVVMLYFSVLQAAVLFVSPSATPTPQPQHATITLPGPVTTIILVVITLIMTALTLYALVKLPMNIVKTSSKAVHQASHAVTPVVLQMQHKKDTKKARKKLSTRVIVWLKLSLVALPILLAFGSSLLSRQFINHSVAMIISYGLACCSILFFVLQYTFAKLFRLPIEFLR